MGLGEESHRNKVPFHHVISRICVTNMALLLMVTPSLAEVGFVRISHRGIAVPLPFHSVPFRRKSIHTAHT